MTSITLSDRDDDDLYLRAGTGNSLLEVESDDGAYFIFTEGQREEVVRMRDLLNAALGDDTKQEEGDISLNEAIMRLAALHGRMVKFRYAKGKGDVIETRKLVPQEVRAVKGKTIFVGQDPDRDDEFRAYRVDRMKGEVTIV